MSTIALTDETPTAPSTRSSRLRRWTPRGVLALTMLATGAAGLIYEYVLSTVLSYLLGNSIEQFSITIGVMFAMMGIGGFLQKFLRNSLPELFVSAELVLVVLGGFAPIILQWAYAYAEEDFGWIKFIYTCLLGFLVGVEIPLIMRINERFTNNLGSNIAGTWAWDYIGGAVGVILWILLLRQFVPVTHISFVVACFNLLVAVLSLIFFWKRGMLKNHTNKIGVIVATALISIGMIAGATQVDAWSDKLTQQLYDDPINTVINTKYQNIVLTEGPHPTDPSSHNYQLWLNGNKQFSSVDERIYHEYLVHPSMSLAARHQRVLILGGGDGLALREILKYQDVKSVTLVDLDPEMIKLAKTHPVLSTLNRHAFDDARVITNLNDPALNEGVADTGKKRKVIVRSNDEEVNCEGRNQRGECTVTPITKEVAEVNVFNIDADKFLSAAKGQWDVVIVDLPDPNSVELAKLYSKEFYGKIKRILSPDGITVVQSTSPYHSKETFLCILRTMAAAGMGVVPYHDNVPSFGDWGWIMASPTLGSKDLAGRAQALKEFSVPTEEIGAANVQRALIFNLGWLTSTSKEISTVMRPVVFDYYVYEGWKIE
ncbi:polyamine aminopropyltransferase [Candidatus Saccharibacteria bacterium]|nr:MAG: polyamine aminopropyltransferase [Candidatus Saccharibacteria bacterium]